MTVYERGRDKDGAMDTGASGSRMKGGLGLCWWRLIRVSAIIRSDPPITPNTAPLFCRPEIKRRAGSEVGGSGRIEGMCRNHRGQVST